MRIRLFEFEDLSWFPDYIRTYMTDYLCFFLKVTSFYKPVIPLLKRVLNELKTNQIIDLCSGGGGNIEEIHRGLSKDSEVKIILTDKFPNLSAFEYLHKKSSGKISFIDHSVDAMKVPPHLHGLRTIFSGFHHFDKTSAKTVLKDAVLNNSPIAIFDGGDRNIFTILGILLFHPIGFLLFTPFINPFNWKRILFTYLIPVVPICTIWDGIVSIIRLYSPDQLLSIAMEVEPNSYKWSAGKKKNDLGMNVSYLIGYPV